MNFEDKLIVKLDMFASSNEILLFELISHKYKIIFIHIPKCAGSSIEYYFNVAPFKWKESNRLHLTGWDKKLKMHLQHASAEAIIANRIVIKSVWDEYFKFAFVRNPWDRAFSDYHWMMKDRKLSGSFEQYLNATGPFEKHLSNTELMHYRGDHLTPQHEFIYDANGQLLVDYVGRFENLENDFKEACSRAQIDYKGLPHIKKNILKREDYHEFYDDEKKELVAKKYARDIELFGYEF